MPPAHESEWLTRKKRIDPPLDAAGWTRLTGQQNHKLAGRTEEEETANGPGDYALWLDNRIVSVVEARKLTVGPQNVLSRSFSAMGRPPGPFGGLLGSQAGAANSAVRCCAKAPRGRFTRYRISVRGRRSTRPGRDLVRASGLVGSGRLRESHR